MNGRLCKKAIILLLLFIGSINFGKGMYINAKALLAQKLLSASWSQTLATHQQITPWPWADTWPVARMWVPQHSVDQIVLAGDSGRTLAFGPGYRLNTPLPGTVGNSIISAHRDTHFKFLKNLNIGEVILVQNTNSNISRFKVISISVMHMKNAELPDSDTSSLITLVTCYPFSALAPNSEYRYVVIAQKDEGVTI